MKISVGDLRKLIAEARYRARAPHRLNLPDLTVDGQTTREAAENASKEWIASHGKSVDPFSVDLEPAKDIPEETPLDIDEPESGEVEIDAVWDAAGEFFQRLLNGLPASDEIDIKSPGPAGGNPVFRIKYSDKKRLVSILKKLGYNDLDIYDIFDNQ